MVSLRRLPLPGPPCRVRLNVLGQFQPLKFHLQSPVILIWTILQLAIGFRKAWKAWKFLSDIFWKIYRKVGYPRSLWISGVIEISFRSKKEKTCMAEERLRLWSTRKLWSQVGMIHVSKKTNRMFHVDWFHMRGIRTRLVSIHQIAIPKHATWGYPKMTKKT